MRLGLSSFLGVIVDFEFSSRFTLHGLEWQVFHLVVGIRSLFCSFLPSFLPSFFPSFFLSFLLPLTHTDGFSLYIVQVRSTARSASGSQRTARCSQPMIDVKRMSLGK